MDGPDNRAGVLWPEAGCRIGGEPFDARELQWRSSWSVSAHSFCHQTKNQTHLGQCGPDIALAARPKVERKQAGAVHDERDDARENEDGDED